MPLLLRGWQAVTTTGIAHRSYHRFGTPPKEEVAKFSRRGTLVLYARAGAFKKLNGHRLLPHWSLDKECDGFDTAGVKAASMLGAYAELACLRVVKNPPKVRSGRPACLCLTVGSSSASATKPSMFPSQTSDQSANNITDA